MVNKNRLRELAGLNSILNEKYEGKAAQRLDAQAEATTSDDIKRKFAIADIKKGVEDTEDGEVADLSGVLQGVATGVIAVDDNGKIAESDFGMLRTLKVDNDDVHERAMGMNNLDTITTSIDFGGDNYYDDVVVTYEYTPGEPQTYDYHGSAEHVEIEQIVDENGNTLDIDLLDARQLARLEDEIIDNVHQSAIDRDDGRADYEYERGVERRMFGEGTLSRYMVELVVDEMKKGLDAKAISENLSFDFNDVKSIVEHFSDKLVKRGNEEIDDQEGYDEWQKSMQTSEFEKEHKKWQDDVHTTPLEEGSTTYVEGRDFDRVDTGNNNGEYILGAVTHESRDVKKNDYYVYKFSHTTKDEHNGNVYENKHYTEYKHLDISPYAKMPEVVAAYDEIMNGLLDEASFSGGQRAVNNIEAATKRRKQRIDASGMDIQIERIPNGVLAYDANVSKNDDITAGMHGFGYSDMMAIDDLLDQHEAMESEHYNNMSDEHGDQPVDDERLIRMQGLAGINKHN